MALTPETVAEALQRQAAMATAGIAAPLDAVFMTVKREPDYIHATLQSFLESDPAAGLLLPVTVLVGNGQADHLRQYQEWGLARVVPMDAEEVAAMDGYEVEAQWRPHFRCAVNYYRCLTAAGGSERARVVFEDDISFARGWLSQLLPQVEEAHRRHGDHFLLSLYSAIPFEGEAASGAMHLPHFWGAQGIYYPASRIERAAAFIAAHGVRRCRNAYDLLIQEFCREEEIPMVALRHSLVQHEGMVGTGVSAQSGHRSPTFLP
jgi:hypothetical protein